jgi:Uma2 family endonuclease
MMIRPAVASPEPDDIPIGGTILATGVSHEDFMNGYEGMHVEWVNGAVIEMPSITDKHDALSGFLRMFLTACLEVSGGGRVCADPMIMKMEGVSSRAPDLQVLLPENTGKLHHNIVIGAADLVIEIVSPGSQRTDRVEKFREYERGGVPEYWILDAEYQEALFYQLNDAGLFERHSPDENGIYHSKMLPKLRLPVSLLWRETFPTLRELLQLIESMMVE